MGGPPSFAGGPGTSWSPARCLPQLELVTWGPFCRWDQGYMAAFHEGNVGAARVVSQASRGILGPAIRQRRIITKNTKVVQELRDEVFIGPCVEKNERPQHMLTKT